MRIVSLLPSCTEIVLDLSLREHLVGVTHECEVDGSRAEINGVLRVTTTVLSPEVMSCQGAIDRAVKKSMMSGISLYTVQEQKLREAKPTIILTQTLCDVCAPAYNHVTAVCAKIFNTSIEEGVNALPVRIVSLEPTSLDAVVDTFLTIADTCGVYNRGVALQEKFRKRMARLEACVAQIQLDVQKKPSVVLLEWIEPLFDGGHWIPDMISAAGCVSPAKFDGKDRRSEERTLQDLVESDPDVIIIACCGFDLRRNCDDTRKLLENMDPSNKAGEVFRSLRAVQSGALFALEADQYFARPSPSLAAGAAIIARCAYDKHAPSVKILEETLGDFLPKEGVGFERIVANKTSEGVQQTRVPDDARMKTNLVKDLEDLQMDDCWKLHEEAVKQGKATYKDPATGYDVFTRLAHEQRQRCCGSGCRHCPFGHEALASELRADKIQQPAFLHERRQGEDILESISPEVSTDQQNLRRDTAQPRKTRPRHRDIVFFSTGKDSFLALRRWISMQVEKGDDVEDVLDRLILLTTFDADSRRLAHQDTYVHDALKQAVHLDLDLLAVPLHPGMEYTDRIESSLELIRTEYGAEDFTLVFGDLHLEEIRDWRIDALGNMGKLEYPIFGTPYETLVEDLKKSGVPCTITACEYGQAFMKQKCEAVQVGRLFDQQLRDACVASGWDTFGENGEFHTLAQVWEVPRLQALGLDAERD